MLAYNKLWILLEKRGMKKTDLKKIISSATLAKLSKNETISSTVIEKICGFLNCQPGDIMEYISDEQMRETMLQLDTVNKAMLETLKAQGITQEQFATMMEEVMPEIIKSMFEGGTPMTDILTEALEQKEN